MIELKIAPILPGSCRFQERFTFNFVHDYWEPTVNRKNVTVAFSLLFFNGKIWNSHIVLWKEVKWQRRWGRSGFFHDSDALLRSKAESALLATQARLARSNHLLSRLSGMPGWLVHHFYSLGHLNSSIIAPCLKRRPCLRNIFPEITWGWKISGSPEAQRCSLEAFPSVALRNGGQSGAGCRELGGFQGHSKHHLG